MISFNLKNTVMLIFSGYMHIGRKILLFILALGLTAGISIVVVYPLWYFASEHAGIYTIVILSLFVFFCIFLIIRRVVKNLQEYKSLVIFFRKIIYPFILKAASTVFFIVFLYAIIVLFIFRILFAAIPLTLGYFIFLGYTLYGKKDK